MWPFSKMKKEEPGVKKRAYAAAVYNRLVSDWIAQGTSADAELRGSLRILRNRSRQLGRDNDYVKNAFRSIRKNVVGLGIPFQGQVRKQRGGDLDDVINGKIEDAWEDWTKAENCDTAGKLSFAEIQRLVISSIAESGEVIVRMIPKKFGESAVPFALEIIESDLLDDNYNGVADNGNEIRMGVEVDKWQRPVAFHFFTKHPGDYQYASQAASLPASQQRIRIDAKEIIHLFITDRVSQTRGVPWLVSAILRLHHLSGFEEGTIIQARAAAALMGFIQSPEGEAEFDAVQDMDRVTDFQPGVFKYLAPGETVTVPQLGTPKADIEPFTRLMLRGIAAGIGQSYENLSKDYSQSNYSSSRLAIIDERDEWRILQSWLNEKFNQKVYERWLDMAVLSGVLALKNYELNPKFYRKVRWLPRGWAWVDPLKETQAYKNAVRSGFASLTDVVAQNGGDIEDILQTRARENTMAEKYGLVLDTDPKMVSENGTTQNPSGPDPIDDPNNDPQTADDGSEDSAPAKKK